MLGIVRMIDVRIWKLTKIFMTIIKKKRSPEYEKEKKRREEQRIWRNERKKEIFKSKKTTHITNWASHVYQKNNLRKLFVRNLKSLRHLNQTLMLAMDSAHYSANLSPSSMNPAVDWIENYSMTMAMKSTAASKESFVDHSMVWSYSFDVAL